MPQTSTIAIVDDDDAIREALDSLVQSCGYESRLFTSAEDFLAHQDRATIDCMLLDVKMPGLSGLELQDRLNQQPSKPPIIFMTSYRDEKTRSVALDGGALAFLAKPVEVACLIHFIELALKR
ncbi:response regulator transcription factor [Rhizobium sp. LCM 4573]|uniref:response regulator transcription factor n=1 Tax=Rhizobium sp. LCM 4573 TaxID=1848291 RepID=UPI0008DABC15|nr:response regulator [Rhizobium sp. LCM 4573]OHV82607.1 two-component system response regulator [Rhizobium sp. LCM 4573]